MDLPNERIPFPEKEYAVPDVVKIVANHYGIRLEDLRSGDRVFQAMDQRIRDTLRAIEEKEWTMGTVDEPDVKRRRRYPGKWIDKAVNEVLIEYFPKVEAGQENSLRKKWEALADEYVKRCRDGSYRDEENEYYIREFSKSEDEKALSDSMAYYVKQMLTDIVFQQLIELDEEGLRKDLATSLRMTEDYEPTFEDMHAIERLKDFKNYYKWKNKKLENLLKD